MLACSQVRSLLLDARRPASIRALATILEAAIPGMSLPTHGPPPIDAQRRDEAEIMRLLGDCTRATPAQFLRLSHATFASAGAHVARIDQGPSLSEHDAAASASTGTPGACLD